MFSVSAGGLSLRLSSASIPKAKTAQELSCLVQGHSEVLGGLLSVASVSLPLVIYYQKSRALTMARVLIPERPQGYGVIAKTLGDGVGLHTI